MLRVFASAIVSATVLIVATSSPAFAAGMDGHWSGTLSGEKGSGEADVVVNGKQVTYSYQQSPVPVEWEKVSKSRVSFGNKIYTLTLTSKGAARFTSQKYGNAAGTLAKQ